MATVYGHSWAPNNKPIEGFNLRPLLQLNDAYEEVDEQRQSVASWKRKAQKAQGEANDIRNSIVVGLSLARRLFVSISWGPILIEGGLHVLRS